MPAVQHDEKIIVVFVSQNIRLAAVHPERKTVAYIVPVRGVSVFVKPADIGDGVLIPVPASKKFRPHKTGMAETELYYFFYKAVKIGVLFQ